MAWSGCRYYRLVFDSWWTCDGKNSLEFECTAAVMHGSSLWMLREEEGLSRTSWAVAQGGGATDAFERRGVVTIAT
jgi:hypothetical protein